MCNDFGNRVPYDDYLQAFSQIRVPVVFPVAAPNLEPRDDIWPTETAPVFAAAKRAGEIMEADSAVRSPRRRSRQLVRKSGSQC